MRGGAVRSRLMLLALVAAMMLPTMFAAQAEARPERTGSTRKATVTCDRVLVFRRGTARILLRNGYRAAGKGRYVRRIKGRTVRICTRRKSGPAWVNRRLGSRVHIPARRLRAGHDISALDFPATLTGPFRINLPGGLGTSGWRMLDVPPAKLVAFRSGARYETSEYDVVLEAGYGTVKESIVVHTRQGLRSWRWRLTYTKGRKPYVDGKGRIIYGGKVVLARPLVQNGRGRVVMRPRWKLKGNIASFTVNDRHLGLPYVVDPTADFPQRIHPDKVTGTRITGAEDIRGTLAAPASSCTKLPFSATGEAIWGSMLARDATPGAAIATATPSGGANGWALQDGTTFEQGKKIFAVAAPDDQTVFAVGEYGFGIKSTDGGCTWSRLTTGTPNDLYSIAAPTAAAVWVAGKSGTLRRSTDGGASFANANSTGVTSDLNAIDALDANVAMVAGTSGIANKTTNGGATWTNMTGTMAGLGGAIFRAVDMLDANVAWIAADGRLYKTTNGGANWGAFQNNAGPNINSIAAITSNIAWAVGDSGTILRTIDGGTWNTQTSPTANSLRWVSAVDANTAWAGGTGGALLFTSNGGTNWTQQTSPSTAAGSDIYGGVARSAQLAWTGDSRGWMQRFYPAGGAGSWGWVSEAAGGTTLSTGPWTVGARICREPYSTGNTDVSFRARAWKVNVSGGNVTGSTPLTEWSAASASVSLAGGACASPSLSVAPTSRSMLPTQHFYVEYALRVNGNARVGETVSLRVADPDTYIDFSSPAADMTPPPTNLRISTAIAPTGWTNVTPTFRADLNDPDWYHHIEYQLCSDAACTTVVASGTSAFGQLLGSTTDSWGAPSLPDGFYYVRARTVEDTGETDTSTWTPIDPDLATNLCTASDVGPCDKFGVDTNPPSAPGTVNDGTGADITFTPNASMLSANWGAATDGGGIRNYEYCMSTSLSGSDCAGTVVQAWASNGSAATTVTRSGLALNNGQIYYTCVRAVDMVGNIGGATCSNGQTVDTAAPPASAAVRDGSGSDLAYTASTSQLEANWDAVADVSGGSGLARYDACFSTSSTGTDCAGSATSPWASTGTTTNVLRTGLALINGTTYYACVRAVDNVGNVGATRCSDGIIVDTGAPTASWTSWTENSAYLYSPGGGSADLLWYNPAAPLEAGIYARGTVTATDASSGMQRVDFPDLAAGAAWGAGGTDSIVGAGDLWTWDYTFSGGGAIGDPALNNATALDNVGNATGAPALNFRIEPDSDLPAVGTMTAWSGLQSTTSISHSIDLGTDVSSGIARWVMDVQFAPLVDGVCQPWDPWIPGESLSGYSGSATNGTTLNVTHYLNDSNFDGVPEYYDSFCFRTQVRVYDNVQNVSTIPPNGFARFDFADPEISITGPPDGSDQRATFDITGRTNDLWEGTAPEYPNTGSGIAEVEVTWELADGPDADALPDATGTACASITAFTGTWDDLGWTCTWNTTSPLLADGVYTVFARARDRSGRWSPIASRSYRIDNNPPIAAWHSWDDYGSAYMHALGNVAWVNPTAPAGAYQLDARVTAYDLGFGMARVEFPAMGAGWTPLGASDATFTSPVPAADAWTREFTYADPSVIAEPGVLSATAYDLAGNGAPIGYEVRLDGTDPTGMDATVVDGLQATPIVDVTLTNGTEGVLESGLGAWSLEYETAPLVNDTCGAWGGTWTSIASGAGLAPATYAHDVTALGSACYRYRLNSIDNVGNVGTSTPLTARRVDLVAPTVNITSPADASSQSATFTIAGTADDGHSGIDRVQLTWTGPETPGSGTICDPATLGGASPSWTFSCDWNTTTFDDGWYTITATSFDRAGNASATDSITVLVDNQPPLRAWHSWDDYGSSWMHSLAHVAWVNPTAPAGAYQLDARVTASDAGSGVDRVEFPGLGTGWTPGAGTTNATFTSPVPVADAYTMAYAFTDPPTLVAPGTQTATAYDGAGNSGTIDFEVRLDGTDPTGMDATVVDGRQSTPIVTVTLTGGSEGALESGLGSWQLFVDTAPLADDTCGAWTNAWTSVTSGIGIAPASYDHDVTATGSNCYRYRLDVTDNVGNLGSSTPATARRVDLVAPTVIITSPADGSVQGGTITLAGSAGDDHTGIDRVVLTWTGPDSPGSGTICNPATLGGSGPTWSFSCDWVTGTSWDDGTYVVTATSHDRAGNVSATHSITILLDNNPPYVAFHSFTESTPYTYWAGPDGTNNQLWYNPSAPAGSYAFDVLVTASDPFGVDRVEFDAAGTGWTGGLPATQTVPVAVDRYAQTYSFDTSGVVADPLTLNATAFDTSLVNSASVPFEFTPDAAAPANGGVSNPNGYHGSTTISVTIASGDDGTGSGIQGWTLLRDTGTLSGGSCVSWTGYTTTVATGIGAVSGTEDDIVADPSCARYRLVVTDNVGNVGTFDGTAETKIDLTPPTGSLTLAENTGTQWTYLVSATRMYVNTGTGTSGSFDVGVTADAASGILDVTFPALATGFTGSGVMPGPGTSFVRTYSWTGIAGTPPVPVSAVVRSNSLGTLGLPFEIVADPNAPTGSTVSHDGGFTTSTSLTITYSSGTDGGSGLASYQLQREVGTLAGGACTWSGTWANIGPAGGTSYDDTTLVHASCYRYRVAATDNVGNVGYSPVSSPRMVDTTAPTGASVTLTENVNTAEQWVAAPDLIWVKAAPTAASSFNISVTADDPESGTGAAVFPSLGSTFVFTSTGSYTARYDWSPTAVAPVSPTVLVANGSGLTTTIPFTVMVDGDVPTGATLDQEAGFVTDFSVDVSYTTGSDGTGSGIETWRIERQSGAYDMAMDSCGSWTTWATYTPAQPASPFVDTNVVQPTCYRYRVVEIDYVGNRTNTYDGSGDITKVINDITPPEPFDLVLPTNPALPAITTGQAQPACGAMPAFTSATPTFSWSASSDTESGLSHYDVYLDGTGSVDGTVAAPGTSWTSPTLPDGQHSLGVRALDMLANYRNAGPAFPTSILVDTTAPTGSLAAPADGSWTSDTTPTLDWNATDAACLARIEVYLDGAATPAAVASGTEGSWTPGTALSEGMHSWSFVAWDVAGNSTSVGPFTFGIDTTAPTGLTAVFPADGSTEDEGELTFQWSTGTDGGSGVARYDLVIDGTPAASSLTVTSNGTHPIYGGPDGSDPNRSHTWHIRAYDAVGNYADFPFAFTARWVADTIAPDAFDLLSPTDGAPLASGDPLTWAPSWDFKGVTQYRIYIDGNLTGTVAGNVTSFTPATGSGSPICTINYDPGLGIAGCLAGPTYSGTVADWNTTTVAGWSASGNAFGVGDQSLPTSDENSGFDGDRIWTAVEYDATIPAAGADLRFEHRYNTHMIGEVAYDGGTIELMVDDEANGFGDDAFLPTCEFGTIAIYGTTVRCNYEIIENVGGPTTVMGGADETSHPIYKQNSFAGDSGGTVQTTMHLSDFAGMNVRIRFRMGTDGCFTQLHTNGDLEREAYCDDPELGAPGYFPIQWRIDDVALADPTLATGLHTWYVVARDAAGNTRQSSQTWTFDLQP